MMAGIRVAYIHAQMIADQMTSAMTGASIGAAVGMANSVVLLMLPLRPSAGKNN
jgi:hypothetical protein